MLRWMKEASPVWVALIAMAGSAHTVWLSGRNSRRIGKPNGHGPLADMAEDSLKILKDLQPQVHQLRSDLSDHIHDGHPVPSRKRDRVA